MELHWCQAFSFPLKLWNVCRAKLWLQCTRTECICVLVWAEWVSLNICAQRKTLYPFVNANMNVKCNVVCTHARTQSQTHHHTPRVPACIFHATHLDTIYIWKWLNGGVCLCTTCGAWIVIRYSCTFYDFPLFITRSLPHFIVPPCLLRVLVCPSFVHVFLTPATWYVCMYYVCC